MTTPLDIINLAMKACGAIGVGQTPNAEDTNDSFRLLNMMISQWNRKRPVIYHLVDLAFTGTGAVSYTVGPGGNFNVAQRPERLEFCYYRLLTQTPPNQVDYSLDIIESREDYSSIALKQLAGPPQIAFLDTSYPLGNLYIWPLPSNQYQIHIVVKAALSRFVTIQEDIVLPPEYEEAILYNLAYRLALNFQIPSDARLLGMAKASLTTIMNANTQLEHMTMPDELVGTGVYNIFSDRYIR